jgi:cytochrome c oxidase subunit 2
MDKRRSIIAAVIAGVLATAAGIAISYAIHWFPAASSSQAKRSDDLYHVLVIACVPIFVVVTGVILYCVWQFRMKPGEELKDGPPLHGNTRLEVVWTIFPAVLLLSMIAYSFVVLHDNEKKPAREINVDVTATQFAWTFQYPSSVTHGAPVSSTQLYLPMNESVRFNLRSRDVIHAFWIPAFRLQEDVVPGITVHYRATPDRLGKYPIVCNLLCGIGHSLMRSAVHVVTPAQFSEWLSKQHSSTAGAGPPAAAGAAPSGGSPGTATG